MTDLRRVDLPRGQWADIRPRLKVKGRDLIQRHGVAIAPIMPKMIRMEATSKQLTDIAGTGDEVAMAAGVEAALEDLKISADEMETMQAFQHASLLAWVAAWSFPYPLTIEGLEELDVDEYDVLIGVCGPLSLQVMTEKDMFGPDGAMNPESPTGPSPATPSGDEGSAPASTPPMVVSP